MAARRGPRRAGPTAVPVPEELRSAFIEAVWRSLAGRDAPGSATRSTAAPTDLFAYQELVSEVRPDWIIETGTGDGGRALFLASICDLLGHGRVLSIDAEPSTDRPAHPRITYVVGRPTTTTSRPRSRELAGTGTARRW